MYPAEKDFLGGSITLNWDVLEKQDFEYFTKALEVELADLKRVMILEYFKRTGS